MSHLNLNKAMFDLFFWDGSCMLLVSKEAYDFFQHFWPSLRLIHLKTGGSCLKLANPSIHANVAIPIYPLKLLQLKLSCSNVTAQILLLKFDHANTGLDQNRTCFFQMNVWFMLDCLYPWLLDDALLSKDNFRTELLVTSSKMDQFL